MNCPHCGAFNPDGSKFCAACGENMTVAPAPAPAPAPTAYYEEPAPAPSYDQPVSAQPAPSYEQPYQQQQYPQQQYPQQYPQPPYQQQYPQQYPQGAMQYQQAPPALQLKTNRKLWKLIVFSLITFGIYGIVVLSNVSTSINTAASRYDGKHTMHFCLVTFLFSWLTFGILPLVWFSKISTRIGNELTRRGINYSFSAKHFWLWGFLGSIIIAGPFIYYHRLLTAMNLICEDYNRVG